MNYNIKLFVHGVPNGQDTWGNPGTDAKYIEAFYGRKSNVAKQMILEVMHFGGETNAYYTFYNDKIQDRQNRPGSYFALTLRINYYYADIQNIYNLLEAAFNKYIIGTVLEHTGGGYRFLVSQLNQANEAFIALEKELNHYLMQFSNNEDFVSLSGFKSNGQNEYRQINLLEAAANDVSSHIKSTGKISVSSLYPTSKEQQIINKMNSEIQAAQQKTQKIVQDAQRDKELGIQAVKDEYKSQLRDQKDKDNKDKVQLREQVEKLNLELQEAQSYKKFYEESKKKLEEKDKLLAELKKGISGLSGIFEQTGISSVSPNIPRRSQRRSKKIETTSSGFISFIKKIPPSLLLFAIIIILLIFCLIFLKSCNSFTNFSLFDNSKKELVEQEGGDEVLEYYESADYLTEENEHVSADSPDEAQETLESLKAKFPNAKIDISNIEEANGQFMKVSSGVNYTISIKGTTEDLHGEWVYNPNDFYIQDSNIIPKRAGSCRIVYKVNGIDFLDKTINVKP